MVQQKHRFCHQLKGNYFGTAKTVFSAVSKNEIFGNNEVSPNFFFGNDNVTNKKVFRRHKLEKKDFFVTCFCQKFLVSTKNTVFGNRTGYKFFFGNVTN